MYRHFFGLEELPFNITPDSRFLFLSQRHKEALAALLYGVKERKGFISLTGIIGSGKTTVCRAFIKELDPVVNKVAIILNSFLSDIELLQTINQELGLPAESASKKVLIDTLNEFLLCEHAKGHNIILIIDEAQNLIPPVLEQIRMLSNLETETDKLLQIILIGQPELNTILELPNLEQLNQRISVKYYIDPLSPEEIGEYIQYRLNVAKVKIKIDFTPSALKAIYKYTDGIPRKINLLCDRILLVGYVEGKTRFDDQIVEKAAAEIQGGLKNREIPVKVLDADKLIGKPYQYSEKRMGYLPIFIFIACMIIVILLSGAIAISIAERKVPYSEALKKSEPEYVKPVKFSTEKNPEPVVIKSLDDIEKKKQPEEKAPDITPTPIETPIPTPSETPKPPDKKVYKYALQYDNNGLVRISDPELAYQAVLLSWLNLWNIKVDLSDFQKYPAELIKKFDLAVNNDKLGLRKFECPWKFTSVVKFDTPLILKLNANKGELEKFTKRELTDWILLLKIEGQSCTIADPVYGFFVIKVAKLDEVVENVVLPYFDKEGFSEIVFGEQSDRVKKMQQILAKRKMMKEEANGIFDKTTEKAIKNLQKASGFEETGKLTPETVIMLCVSSFITRPRLYSAYGVN